MKKIILSLLLLLPLVSAAQSIASKRASRIGKGINLSWMDNRWKGTAANEHRDYMDTDDLPYYKEQIELIYTMGFRFIRFPVCFDLWYAHEAPYQLLKPAYYQALDSIVQWTGEKGMLLSIDNHHGTLKSETQQADVTRICALWKFIAQHYQHTDPERVFFELFNEPHEVNESEWQEAATRMIEAVRSIAPQHTLIVGANKWNSITALQEMPLLADDNLIYTFHFYDPFLFTHQGASWTGDATLTKGIPYPYRMRDMPEANEKTANTWAKRLFEEYPTHGNYTTLHASLQAVKKWSEKNKVPIFCGEWGAYKKYASPHDRCQYLSDMYSILTELHIPNAMWEWNMGFSFFDEEPAWDHVNPCMKKALRLE